jgi:hypothetical protein
MPARSFLLRAFLLRGLALAAALAASAAAARADLMSACAPEVSRYCADVSAGRGRVSACLAGRIAELGPACLPEVQAVARSRLVPGDMRKVFDPSFRAALPAACAGPAARLCPGVTPGDGRVFACLYARSTQVDASCAAAAEATLKAN